MPARDRWGVVGPALDGDDGPASALARRGEGDAIVFDLGRIAIGGSSWEEAFGAGFAVPAVGVMGRVALGESTCSEVMAEGDGAAGATGGSDRCGRVDGTVDGVGAGGSGRLGGVSLLTMARVEVARVGRPWVGRARLSRSESALAGALDDGRSVGGG